MPSRPMISHSMGQKARKVDSINSQIEENAAQRGNHWPREPVVAIDTFANQMPHFANLMP